MSNNNKASPGLLRRKSRHSKATAAAVANLVASTVANSIGAASSSHHQHLVTGADSEDSPDNQSQQQKRAGMRPCHSDPMLLNRVVGAAAGHHHPRPPDHRRSGHSAAATALASGGIAAGDARNEEDNDCYCQNTPVEISSRCCAVCRQGRCWKDTRTHVVGELFDTEKSYVESLQILVNKYLEPLKSSEGSEMVHPQLVEEIFFQIPEILAHHEAFLEELKQRVDSWDVAQKVGDVIVKTFAREEVIETYSAFINHWKHAKEAVKVACHQKTAFERYINATAREHRGRLAMDCALDSLLIMPVQRIPRYELLIKMLLKHTDPEHPDHADLVAAQREVHSLALKINDMEKEARDQERRDHALMTVQTMVDGLKLLSSTDSMAGASSSSLLPLSSSVHSNDGSDDVIADCTDQGGQQEQQQILLPRAFLRYDLVSMPGSLGTKKERAVFLFTDLLVICSLKRRTGAIRKPDSVTSETLSALEGAKYKLLMRIPLDDLEIAKAKDENLKKILREVANLEEDLATIQLLQDAAHSLHSPHSDLDNLLREMNAALARQLAEKQLGDSQLLCTDLTVATQDGFENVSITFMTPEKRAAWEEAFLDAKLKLASSANRRPTPDFLYPLPIRKTRAGLQFTCAAPTLGLNTHGLRDVWVCNSDGYVGQVCVLSLLQPNEPAVQSCNGVCNSRILCIASIPASDEEDPSVRNAEHQAQGFPGRGAGPQASAASGSPVVSKDLKNVIAGAGVEPEGAAAACTKSDCVVPSLAISGRSISTEADDAHQGDTSSGTATAAAAAVDRDDEQDGRVHLELDSSDSSSSSFSDDEDEGFADDHLRKQLNHRLLEDKRPASFEESTSALSVDESGGGSYNGHDYSTSSASPSSVAVTSSSGPLRGGSLPPEPYASPQHHQQQEACFASPLSAVAAGDARRQPTMWIGTEDGTIHVYNCNDNIRIKKNKLKIQLGSAIQAIVYFDKKVFVAVAKGTVSVFTRDHSTWVWNINDPDVVHVDAIVTRLAPVVCAKKLWCACLNRIRIIDTNTLEVEHSIMVHQDPNKGVANLAASGYGVWVAMNGSSSVRLYHATSHDLLTEVNAGPAVAKMLSSCDDIIRQHKAACLRVTALLCCKDLLWIGTSAGVILVVPLPHISSKTTKLQQPLHAMGLPMGHTGHVRFLMAVESIPRGAETRLQLKQHQQASKRSPFKQGNKEQQHHRQRHKNAGYKIAAESAIHNASNRNQQQQQQNCIRSLSGHLVPSPSMLVISGGDGLEDFWSSSNAGEGAGRDDSTNHLLLWHV